MAAFCCSGNRRMAQFEDDLIQQQRQLDTLRKTLSNVIDVATHRLHKEHVASKLKTKVDVEVMEKRHEDMKEVQRQQLFEALANKADTWALDECRRELADVMRCGIADLEQRQVQLAQHLAEDRAGVEDWRREQCKMLGDSEEEIGRHQEALQSLSASLATKTDVSTFEEQSRQVASLEESAKKLEVALTENAREHFSALMALKLDSEVMQKATADALQRHRRALDSTNTELAALSGLEQRFKDFQEQASSKQEEWLLEKEQAANHMYSVRKERQDEELVQALSKKADVSWYQQQKALLDATQLSLAEMHQNYQDLQTQLLQKIDHLTLERTQERLHLEIVQARQETSDVSDRLDRHQHQLDVARAQLIEMIRQQAEIEGSLGEKADKASLEKLETLQTKLEEIERRQEIASLDFNGLQEQFYAALRSRSNVSGGFCLPKAILEPPPSPRERLVNLKPTPARMKYRCEVSPALSARRKIGGN